MEPFTAYSRSNAPTIDRARPDLSSMPAVLRARRDRGPEDHRPDEWRDLLDPAAFDVLDGERRGVQRRQCVAVAVAAVGDEPPGTPQAVLPARQAGVVGAHVLEKEKAAARTQRPRRLGD